MRGWMVSAVLASVVLAGCGSGDEPGSSAQEPSSASSETAASAPASSTPTPTPPTVVPADGPTLVMREATVRLPNGWEVDPTNTEDILVAAVTDVHPQTMGVVAFPETFSDLDTQVQQVRRQVRGRIRYERLPDIYVAGARFYYLSGRDTSTRRDWSISIGGNYGGLNYTVGFSLAGKSAAERAELVESVIASWEWK